MNIKSKNVTKVMGQSEFQNHYGVDEQLEKLCDIFDLFILHPAIASAIAPTLVTFLRKRNKSVAILPNSLSFLYIRNPPNILRALNQKQQVGMKNEIDQLRETLENALSEDKELANKKKKKCKN